MFGVVRNHRSNQTHIASFDRTEGALSFGVPYRKPPDDTVAICGVKVHDGVVMREGTDVRCPTCKALRAHRVVGALDA